MKELFIEIVESLRIIILTVFEEFIKNLQF